MNELDPTLAEAIKKACDEAGQPAAVATQIQAWIREASVNGLSAEEQAQRIGLIRDDIKLSDANEN